MLDPDVVLCAARGITSRQVRGAVAVAKLALTFARLTRATQPALVNGAAELVTVADGQPMAVKGFTIRCGKIVEIDILADPARLRPLDLAVRDD